MTLQLPNEAMNLRLRNGVELPRVGLGTFRSRAQDVHVAVVAALEAGIRHIDTASIYKNGMEIAAALKEVPVAHGKVFITSKVSPYEQGTQKAVLACQEIYSCLAAETVDLLLIHWPGASGKQPTSPANATLRLETWRVLEQLYRQGRCRAIGVSNYEQHHLEQLMQQAEVLPMVNQVEVHPRYPNSDLRKYCEEQGVRVVAYASLGAGELLSNALVCRIAEECQRTPAQVLLRWGLQHDCAVIPKSVQPERIKQYTEDSLLSWNLSSDHMRQLDAMDDGHKYCWNPSAVV